MAVTIPQNSAVAYPIGTSLSFFQLGAGQVTLTPAGGVTFRTSTGAKINAQYDFATALKIGTDEWALTGSLVV